MIKPSYTLMNDEPGAAGGGEVDRGDLIDETVEDEDIEDKAPEAAEAPEVAEAAEPEKTKKKEPYIPLSRHNAILAKERERRESLQRELAQTSRGEQIAGMNEEITAAEEKILKLEKTYAENLTDGELDKATAVMQEIRKTERMMAEAKSDMKIQAAEIRATERARYNTALERIEAAFPTLNPDHEDYSEEVMSEVAELKEAYELKGLTSTQALQKAVKLIVEPRTSKQEIATTAQPRVSNAEVAAERKKDAAIKAAKAVGKTPPSLNNVGMDSDKAGGGAISAAAIMKMNQKEFSKLSEATLAELRGDTL
jgi:hypothetical protein